MNRQNIDKAYEIAKERFAEFGVDTDAAIEQLSKVSLSIHCWQGDDVGGFEKPGAELSGGGLQVTGNYPGKARTADELRADLEKAYSLIPGKHRLNLHAIYGEFGGKLVDRDEIAPEHFANWVAWAKANGLGLDFNATLFSHPKADDGFTLSHQDKAIRDFWIAHCDCARAITSYFSSALESVSTHNLWIPDGFKDIPVDRLASRTRLKESLDEIYSTIYPPWTIKDSVESKLFGIGSESCVVGSHELYMGYALKNDLMLCLDLGHFHPTESVADKISSILLYCPELLLHVSRGVRWDSDHVVITNDELLAVMQEVVRCGLDRVNIALDYFDATVNRVAAWVIGSRAALRAILSALLEPKDQLKDYENTDRLFQRLALLDEMKAMPVGDVWNYYCAKSNIPAGADWIGEIEAYEAAVMNKRV
ncbi:MAG: L-rhamnose isomerase [Armatimonadetes bacterium]|nr:L-rhamnose isomerase [Armatimonadota bacterium]